MSLRSLRGRRWARWTAAAILLAVLGLAAVLAWWHRRAAAPPLSPAERSRLQSQARDLTQREAQLSQHGQYAEATRLQEQALEIDQRLYPADQYPQGHPDLSAGFANLGALLQAQGQYGQAQGLYN